MRTRILSLVVAALLAPALLPAQDEDGPGRGVARISVINGDVSVRRGDSGDTVAAAINAPLIVEDRVYTAASARAEVQFDYANMVRLASETELRLAQLEYKKYTLQLARGTITYRVLREYDPADIEISTPSVSVRPVKTGVYRVSVRDDGASEITVRAGEVEVFTAKGSQRVKSGHTLVSRGDPNDPEFQIVSALAEDEWDRWNERRDRELLASRSYSYVSHDVYGAEDLDAHGRWIDVANYGWVWSPAVAPGWAPYRNGRWSWVDWYGWSWVSYDPWGWAPYHYGRWFFTGANGWCWYPGPVSIRHYWRPALVAFFGYGGGGIGLGFGNVGWVPLAPYEPFYPWYGRGFYSGWRNGGFNQVNIVQNFNIINTYRNARISNGMSYAQYERFGHAGAPYQVANWSGGQATLIKGALPIAPQRDSLRWNDRPVVNPIREIPENRRFFSHAPVVRPERIPFGQQQQAMENFSRGFAGERKGIGVVTPTGPSAPVTPANAQIPSWRIEGSRGDMAAQPSIDSSTGRGVGDNWRRFGQPALERNPAAPVNAPVRFGTPERAVSVEPHRPAEAQPAAAAEGSWRRDWSQRQDHSMERSMERSNDRRNDMQQRQPATWSRPAEVRTPESRGNDPIRFSAPIVRERQMPASSGSMMGGSRSESRPAASSGGSRVESHGGGNGSGGGSRGGEHSGGGRSSGGRGR